ncbi:hypothetical protein CVT26_009592 [Gymnopilus dilepis]|uniref:F-box domain-containing protein n=1 Tax=Gymnopilus dilepis TaxID=231916 RepID=A0A409YII6_9AGAR|nr:hypothetical protein CVT26_009592 [Gymnopilus dilepis]
MASKYVELPTEVLENVFSDVELCSDDPHIDATLQLLRGERTLGVKVIRASLTTRRPLGGVRDTPWIEPTFMVHWTRLRILELRGFPFDSPSDIKRFLSTLRTSCKRLQEFTFRPVSGSLPSQGFELEGLEKVSWQTTIDTPLTPILSASAATLAHITFLGRVIHRRGIQYDEFLKLRFPSLKSLELGSLEHSNTEIRTNQLITTFILAHPSIEHLSLGRSRPSYFIFQLDADQLKDDSLPALKSFEGYPENVTTLVRRRVQSLFSITSLSLCCPKEEEDPTRVLREMVEAVSDVEGMPRQFLSVTKLRFETSAVLNHHTPSNATSLTHHSWMDHLSQLCPNVLTWSGKLPPMNSAHLAKMFAMYEHLEIICLPWLSIIPGMPSALFDYFGIVSERCGHLRFIVARRPEYTERPNQVFILHRDNAGTLVRVESRIVHEYDVDWDEIFRKHDSPPDPLT